MTKKRSIKVYGQSGYKYKDTPTIMLKEVIIEKGEHNTDDGNVLPVFFCLDVGVMPVYP